MTIEFTLREPGVWHYTQHAEHYELDITLSKSDRGFPPTWMCEIVLEDRRPSEPCSAPHECDYGDARVIAGRMIPCDLCSEKNVGPTYRCTWGLPVDRVVEQAKYEVTAINRWEKLRFISNIVAQRWSFTR